MEILDSEEVDKRNQIKLKEISLKLNRESINPYQMHNLFCST